MLEKISRKGIELEKYLEEIILDIQIQMGMGTDKVYFSYDVYKLLEPIQESLKNLNEDLRNFILRKKEY